MHARFRPPEYSCSISKAKRFPRRINHGRSSSVAVREIGLRSMIRIIPQQLMLALVGHQGSQRLPSSHTRIWLTKGDIRIKSQQQTTRYVCPVSLTAIGSDKLDLEFDSHSSFSRLHDSHSTRAAASKWHTNIHHATI